MFSWIWQRLFPRPSFSWEPLPDELLCELGLRLAPKGIYNLCKANRRLNLLFNSEFFWKGKCYHDFGETEPVGTWKETYKERSFNQVFVFGANNFGQLGLGDTRDRRTPTRLPGVRAKGVSTGDYHTIVLDLAGNVLTFGRNDQGQLGIGRIDDEPHPEPYILPEVKAKAVFAGPFQSFFIDLDDNVWAFGNDKNGQLGLENGDNVCVPKRIPGLKAKYISSGNIHTIFIDLEDNVWVTGTNQTDKVSGPKQIQNIKAKSEGVAAGNFISFIVDPSGAVWTFKTLDLDLTITPELILDLEVESVSTGLLYTMVTDTDGMIHIFSPDIIRNFFSLTGPVNVPNFRGTRTASGEYHCLVLGPDHSIWVFGHGTFGELGLGECEYQGKPRQIPGLKGMCISTSNNHSAVLGKRVEEKIGFLSTLFQLK